MPHPDGFPAVYRLPIGITDQAPPEGHTWIHASAYDRAWFFGLDPPPLAPTQEEKRWARRVLSTLGKGIELGTLLPEL